VIEREQGKLQVHSRPTGILQLLLGILYQLNVMWCTKYKVSTLLELRLCVPISEVDLTSSFTPRHNQKGGSNLYKAFTVMTLV